MAKEYYDQKIDRTIDWGGDSKTGGKQVKGSRVQEYIQGQFDDLHASDVESEKKNPSVFGGFVDNVSLKNTDAGSDYVKIVYDTTRHTFFAVTMEGDVEKYHRQYDQYDIYNNGTWPNAYPYVGKMYLYGTGIYLWDGTSLSIANVVASEESVRGIVKEYNASDNMSD